MGNVFVQQFIEEKIKLRRCVIGFYKVPLFDVPWITTFGRIEAQSGTDKSFADRELYFDIFHFLLKLDEKIIILARKLK